MKVLLTGGAGFIGHHVAAHILDKTDWEITFLDRLDISGNLQRIAEIENWDRHRRRCSWRYHDLRAPMKPSGQFDYILHLAALTHVDRSIEDPLAAVYDNVVGTAHILEYARQTGCQRFIYFSTDEVFGPAPAGVQYGEWDRYKSGNPYAATKAGGEELALSYHNTYGVPVIVTHTMNVFGERQHPEKFIPSTIRKIAAGETVTIHADSERKTSGSRFYIDAQEIGSALLWLLRSSEAGEKYNIVGREEVSNLSLAQSIAAILRRLEWRHEMVDFHSSRPGHDLRYALSGAKMDGLGWKPQHDFRTALTRTVNWFVAHPEWLSAGEDCPSVRVA
jgi:dTDP-glucose 4,6-dehydratase